MIAAGRPVEFAHSGLGRSDIDRTSISTRGDRSREAVRASAAIRLSRHSGSLLLPQFTFDETHLLKQRPFRATATAQSGGDHICDLRGNTDWGRTT
jgi:hypothetical protein